jgi:hypothetical protein
MFRNKVSTLPIWVILLELALYTASGNGTIVHSLDVAALVESSDLIVVGQVSTIRDQGTTHSETPHDSRLEKRLLAVLSTEKTLKGTATSSDLTFEFTLPEAPGGAQEIRPGQYGIFFLRHNSAGLGLADRDYPRLPALPGFRVPDEPPLDSVIAELAEVLTYPNSTKSERSTALEGLGSVRTKLATEIMERALETSSSSFQLEIASKLVARNDLAGLPIVERALLNPYNLSKNTVSGLTGSLAGLSDPKSIPALRRLMSTEDERVLSSVVIALRQTRSRDALLPLSDLLNNEQQTVRYYAVAGMGEITVQDRWTPTFPEFLKNEAKYLNYWRDWAASNLPQRPNQPPHDLRP